MHLFSFSDSDPNILCEACVVWKFDFQGRAVVDSDENKKIHHSQDSELVKLLVVISKILFEYSEYSRPTYKQSLFLWCSSI